MGEIISHDFGKADREHARRLADLLQLLKERDEDLLANPGKYFAMASDKLAEQQLFIRSLSDALRTAWMVKFDYISDAPPAQLEPDIVRIDRRDYEALQAIKKLIRDWDNQ